ncbi:inositol 2-dehydrogenase [Paenibacillus sedimenti]|uniref:Inositol 2-dehydrogenase n=1 Tax=Paenibacillus sedimenti TaxID=2770274 RepID=A0A926QJJ6_9BACL|nr:inositol 2-dehydrogenase [Paenibacillus sedimenti]MBD0381791.1 inositol 2-dehydrogenase [Paenibacillus sedimenti]
MKKLSIGIIGAGRIGKIHADNLLRLPGVEVSIVADLFADDALQEWANARGIAQVTKNSDDVIKHPEVDAIFICSLTDSHVPLIQAAAQAGKHIFCEKPISMDIHQTKAAIEAVKAAGVKLQVGFNRRFDHNFKRVREWVEEGKLGDPHIIKITSRDPNPPQENYIEKSGGLFMDMAIHDFDMARFLSGSDVVEVFARGAVLVDPVFAKYGDVDTAITTLTFSNGAIGVIDNSRQAVYGYDQRVEVFGSKGSVSANNDFPNTAEISTSEGIYRDKPLHFFLERYNEAYIEETRKFIESLRNDTEIPATGNDGYQAELIALAAKLSHRLGKPVRIAEALQLAEEVRV